MTCPFDPAAPFEMPRQGMSDQGKVELKPGEGIVTFLGWRKDPEQEATEHFEAVVRFPAGPPPLRVGVVWNSEPVNIVLASPLSPEPLGQESPLSVAVGKYREGHDHHDEGDFAVFGISRDDPQHENIIEVYGDEALRDRVLALLAAPSVKDMGDRELRSLADGIKHRLETIDKCMTDAKEPHTPDGRVPWQGGIRSAIADIEKILSALSKGAEAPGSKDDWQPIETAPRIHDEQLLGWASHKPDGRCYRMIIHWFQPPYTRTGWWVSGSLPVHPRMYAKLPTPPQGLEHGSGQ